MTPEEPATDAVRRCGRLPLKIGGPVQPRRLRVRQSRRRSASRRAAAYANRRTR